MSTLHFASALLPSGWADDVQVVVTDGTITKVTTGVAPGAGDERHQLAIPGIASLHSHAFQRGMAGLAETRGDTADTFWTWRETMYRFALEMTPEDTEAVATLLYVEMLEQGFTRVGEFHYLHHDHDGTPYANPAEMATRIARAAEITGIGLTLLPSFYAHGSFGGAAPHAGQRRFICSVDQFARLMAATRTAIRELPGANVGVAPHSLRAVTPDELAAIAPLAEGGPVHIHAAEQIKEVEECIAWSGRRPVEWLLEHAPVDQRWCLIHATHTTAAEIAALAGSGAVAGPLPDYRGEPRRRHFSDPRIPRRRRPVRHRHRFQCAGRRRRRTASARIWPAVEAPRAQCVVRRSRRLDRPRAVRRCARRRRPGARAADRRTPGQVHAPTSSPSTPRIPRSPDAAGMPSSTAGFLQQAAGAVACVWAGGNKVVEGGRHRLRQKARDTFNAAVRRLVA